MLHYRVSKEKITQHQSLEYKKFDNKEDAEHYAKNSSSKDGSHVYVMENQVAEDEFVTIKVYQQGQAQSA